jgi:hypothetical protein
MAGLAAILAPGRLDAGGGPDTLWTRTYGGPHGDGGNAVFETADSGFMVIGNTFSFGAGLEDIYLVRTDRNGDTLWTRTYGTPEYNQTETALPTHDGGYVIVGYLGTSGNNRGLVLRIDAAGESLWAREYPEACVLRGACQLGDGRYAVTGSTADYPEDVWLAQLDSVGEVLWSKRYGGSNDDWGWTVLQNPDGGYVIAGETWSFGAGHNDFYLIRTDSSGDTLWTRTYGGPGPEGPSQMIRAADGGYLIVGGSNPTSYPDAYLVRTDSGGETLWTRRYGGPWEDEAEDVVAVDGGYVVSGHYGWYSPESSDVWLIGLNDRGDTAWTRTYGGNGQELAFGLRRVSDGGLVITGWTSSFGAGGADVYLIKTDSLGNVAVAEPKASPTRAPALSLSCEPNPSRGSVTISLSPSIPLSLAPVLRLYDAQGRLVRTFTVNRTSFTVWDGTDELGHPLPSGTYFVLLDAAGQRAGARIVLQR